MNFLEYNQLHERCVLYKARAIKAILAILGEPLDNYLPSDSYFYQFGEDEFGYHIHFSDGFNLEGTMRISVLDMYLNGYEDEAKSLHLESKK